ncbi:MAG TPA: FHA domain-containing protein [Agromyces sp.]|nr:FHA domain-containing protein [Agromyces sp.]
MAEPDFIVPPPGLIPAAEPADEPADEPDRTVRDPRPRVLPAFSPPGIVAPPRPPSAARPTAPPARAPRVEAPGAGSAEGAWRLRATGGVEVLLLRPVVLGRDPNADTARAGAATIPLTDPARSVSKTHAFVEVVDGRVTVTDLFSTNGTRVLSAEGEVRELEPGQAADAPNGATLLLGEYAVRLDRVPLDTV